MSEATLSELQKDGARDAAMSDAHAFAKFMRKFWAEELLFPQPDNIRERTRERYALLKAFDAGREYEREREDGDE